MSSSSSDDDYDVTLLKEAIATDFISDSIYQGHSETKSAMTETSVKSLRPNRNEDAQFNELGVTQEFKKHVAKHLVKLLDDSLQSRLKNGSVQSEVKKKKEEGGVKLLTNSSSYIKCWKNESKLQDVKKKCSVKRRSGMDDNDEDYISKLRSVSVDPDYILSKKGIEHWSKRSKAKIFHYKSTGNGKLFLINT